MRTWSTVDLPSAQQFGYWREVICDAFTALDPAAESHRRFESCVVQRDFGEILISDSRSKAQSIVRGHREISRTPTDGFFVNVQLSGTCLIRQDSREVLIHPGEFYLVDTARPFRQDYSDWHVLCLFLPRHILAPRLIAPSRSTAVRLSSLDGALGMIAGTFIQSLQACADIADAAAKESLTMSLADLLGIALGGTSMAQEGGRAAVKEGLREAIKNHARRNATDPELSATAVAARFRISPRYLHKLLEPGKESFTQLVLEERLKQAAAYLASPTADLTICEIALRSGFGDLSHFCRAFKRRFGVSARSFREAAARRRVAHD